MSEPLLDRRPDPRSLPTPAYLDTRGAAAYLSLESKRLQNYRSLGCGPRFVRLGLHAVRYAVADLDAWMEARKVSRKSDPPVMSSPADSGMQLP